MLISIWNIEWDAVGQDRLDLPEETTIGISDDTPEDMIEIVTGDILWDTYGYRHFDFEFRVTETTL